MNKHRLKNYQITLVTSFLFCLVHYPGGFLMLFTFIMQWVFITAFLRWKNIWTIGLYHGWIMLWEETYGLNYLLLFKLISTRSSDQLNMKKAFQISPFS